MKITYKNLPTDLVDRAPVKSDKCTINETHLLIEEENRNALTVISKVLLQSVSIIGDQIIVVYKDQQ